MTVPMQPLCMYCKFFHIDNLEGETCAVYPDGIPAEILDNEVDHRKPYDGDKGVTFSPESDPPKYLITALDALK